MRFVNELIDGASCLIAADGEPTLSGGPSLWPICQYTQKDSGGAMSDARYFRCVLRLRLENRRAQLDCRVGGQTADGHNIVDRHLGDREWRAAR